MARDWGDVVISQRTDFSSASVVKNPPANTGQMGQSLGWEDLLEKEMATHTSILAWEIPWTEEPGGLQSTGSQRVRCDFRNGKTASQKTLEATRS